MKRPMLFALRFLKSLLKEENREADYSEVDRIRMDLLSLDVNGIHSDLLRRYVVDCLNLLGIDNVSSYYWVTDVTSHQYAVPNYLTGRQVNVRVLIDF